MSRFNYPSSCHGGGFPRSRGDEPTAPQLADAAYKFSPLTRG
ncbi:hypothetical protein HMPREF1978_01872 [Actinomyces graevenitzii F0530]|uniref:Uncharacterized protein n=1 Tax=Actinomyces graevenitzii F0530 TaxID=1321817 RepID=U1R6X3_9ACTO|nr:hypothetical protein HMPREF1978_01872 [Actinomyces graevenitzii F0530]